MASTIGNGPSSSVSTLTFNLHGLNQGEAYLIDALSSKLYDLISIQEHWQDDDGMCKLSKLNNDYIVFGKSAMTKSTTTGVLLGRPYGGVATFVKKSLAVDTQCLFIGERIVVIKLCKSLFINVYFPCDDGTVESHDLLVDMLSQLTLTISECEHDCIFVSGDFNINLNTNRRNAVIIKSFLKDFKLIFLTPVDANNAICPTFGSKKGNGSSTIDFICFSAELESFVSLYNVIDSYCNFSDHSPVHLLLSIPTTHSLGGGILDCLTGRGKGKQKNLFPASSVLNITKETEHSQPRFDHGNLPAYYEYTRVLLQPIADEFTSLLLHDSHSYTNRSRHIIESDIEECYGRVINALREAELKYIPSTKVNALKFWWDAELNELKQNSIRSHKLWLEAGKPRAGNIFDLRTRDKFAYRAVIAKHKLNEKCTVSNDLNDALINKKSNVFWKTWKSKVCESKTTLPCIDGSFDETVINRKFVDFFKNTCTVNSTHHDSAMRQALIEKLCDYSKTGQGDYNGESSSINAEVISSCINKLHVGKACGLDKLQCEHLLYAHPILYVILSKLFQQFLLHGFVPSAFGRGLLIPIPKESNCRGILSVDQFRGITISPIISKVFEHCLLLLYKEYLFSSERQFGFKKGIGCAQAIFSVRSVINHFVKNNSTINMCCLDISKAFDRVNHSGLLLKLIERGAPLNFILVLQNWYNKTFCCVKWGNIISDSFRLHAGVRQGGVLSPILFSVFVDNILKKLDHCGCRLFGLSMGSFMYADDLVLLSPSVCELQKMVNICCVELSLLDLKLNESKSVCIRIGKRFHSECCSIVTPSGCIAWADAAIYLGVRIISASNFSCCYDKFKSKFYASFNSIYGKLGKINNPIVTLSLVSSMALPCLLYACEALPLTRAILKSIENPWTRIFMKLFNTFDTKVVRLCQFFTDFMPVQQQVIMRKISFLKSLEHSPCALMRSLHALVVLDELRPLAALYGVEVSILLSHFKEIIRNDFVNSIEQ